MDSITRSKANTNTQVDILIDNKKIATVNTTRGTFKYTIKNNYTKGQHNLSYSYHGDNITIHQTEVLTLQATKTRYA